MFIGSSSVETLSAAETVFSHKASRRTSSSPSFSSATASASDVTSDRSLSESQTVAKFQQLASELSIWISLGGIQETYLVRCNLHKLLTVFAHFI